MARELHERINRERARQGLPSFRWDAALGRIAAQHSRDMATRNYFGHRSPGGAGPAARYLKNGYACGVTVDGVLRNGAENLIKLGPDVVNASGRKGIIGSAVGAWTGSAEERENLLSPHWDREGVGVAVAPDGTVYITVNFC